MDNNFFELHEITSNTMAFVSQPAGWVKVAEGRRYNGKKRIMMAHIDEGGKPCALVPTLLDTHSVGSIHCVLCLDDNNQPCKTPPFVEQLRLMGRTVSPELLAKWHQELARFIANPEALPLEMYQSKKCMARRYREVSKPTPHTEDKTPTPPPQLTGMSQAMVAQLKLEFDEKYQEWVTLQERTMPRNAAQFGFKFSKKKGKKDSVSPCI